MASEIATQIATRLLNTGYNGLVGRASMMPRKAWISGTLHYRLVRGITGRGGFQDWCLKPLGHPSGRAATSNKPPFRLARPGAARAIADRETTASPIARWGAPPTRLRRHYWTAVQSATNFLVRVSSARTTWSRCESVGAPKRTAASHKVIVTGT